MIELECLSAAWAMHKCRQFIEGLPHFELVTDHRLLIPILNDYSLDKLDTSLAFSLVQLSRSPPVTNFRDLFRLLTTGSRATGMMANAGKTGLLYTPSPQHWDLVECEPLLVGEVLIQPSDTILHLGVIIDRNLLLSQQISSLRRQFLFQLHRIGRIRRHLTDDSAKILVHALVLSRLDYCNSLFVGLLKKDTHFLQLTQNATARLIFRKKPSDDATVLLKKLHWLPISQRIDYKLIVLTYRCLHGQAPPPYLSRYIVQYVPGRSLRSDNLGRISVPPKPKLVYYGQRAFSQAAPRQ
jgi:hypothetical protein